MRNLTFETVIGTNLEKKKQIATYITVFIHFSSSVIRTTCQ